MTLLVTLSGFVLVLLLAGGATPAAGPWWDALAAIGFCAFAAIALLGWDAESPTSGDRLTTHRNLGILAVCLATGHAVGYLVVDRTVIEYLLPTAPAYMLAGVVALAVLAGMTLTSLPGPRRRTYPGFAAFRRWHRGLFLTLSGAAVWHVLGTDFSLDRLWQLLIVAGGLGGLPLVAYGLRRRGGRMPVTAAAAPAAANTGALLAGLALLVLCAGFAAVKILACESC